MQLLTLIETSPASKQEKFLALIKEESATWEAELSKRRLSFKRILNWDNQSIGEIVPRIPDKVMGTALWPLSADERGKFMALLSSSQKRKLEEILSLNPPSDGEIVACQIKVVQEVREMFQSGQLRYEKVDADLAIPENIEESLNKGGFTPSLAALPSESQAATLMQAATKESASPSGAPSPAAVMLVEEMKQLRAKLQSALHELQSLQRENQSLKDKLEQIKKIA